MSPFHCLILTEDSGQKSFVVVEGIARRMLRLLGEGAAVDLVEVEPGDERARRAMGFNGYRSTRPRDGHRRIDIAAAIVTQLLRDDMPRFVIVHVDGDCRWSERGPAPGAICGPGRGKATESAGRDVSGRVQPASCEDLPRS